jgi:hypothetical protein
MRLVFLSVRAPQGNTDYYTMSSQGVTYFWDDCTDFQPLESFERDYFLYAQTMRLRMFRQFRMWKAFKVRKAVRMKHPGVGGLSCQRRSRWEWLPLFGDLVKVRYSHPPELTTHTYGCPGPYIYIIHNRISWGFSCRKYCISIHCIYMVVANPTYTHTHTQQARVCWKCEIMCC